MLWIPAALIMAWMKPLLRGTPWDEFWEFVFWPTPTSIVLLFGAIALLALAAIKRSSLLYLGFACWVCGVGAWFAWQGMIYSFRGSHNYVGSEISHLHFVAAILGYFIRSSFLLLLSTYIYRPAKNSFEHNALLALRPCLAIWLMLSVDGLTIAIVNTWW